MEPFEHLSPYELLGVEPQVDAVTLKQAYLREVARYHPDRWTNNGPEQQQYAARRTQRITETYRALARGGQSEHGWKLRAPSASTITPAPTAIEGAHYDQAVALLRAGRPAEALPLLQALQKRDPQYRKVGSLLAEAEAALQSGPHRRIVGLAAAALLLVVAGLGWSFRPWSGTRQPPVVGAILASTQAVAVIDSAPATPTTAEATTFTPSTQAVLVGEALSPTPQLASRQSATAEPVASAVSTPVPPTASSSLIATTPTPPTKLPVPATSTSPAPSVLPSIVPPAGIETGPMLLSNTFSQAAGWLNLTTPSYSIGPRNGAYAMTAVQGAGVVSSFGGAVPRNDVVIGADVTVRNGLAGLLFGPGHSYRLLVDPKSGYRVDLLTPSSVVPIVAPRLSPALYVGTNRLQILAHGTRVTLLANNVVLTRLTIYGPLQGTPVGFVIVTGRSAADATFDNLSVRGQ